MKYCVDFKYIVYNRCTHLRATSHTRLRARTITLQALSLVEKVEPVQVGSTLRLRDQWSMWMQDGCKVYMDSYVALKWIMFYGHLDYFRKPPLGGRPNTNLGDHGTSNVYYC